MKNTIDIKSKILQLGPGEFQIFCDELISKFEKGNICCLGMQAGTNKTTKGNPDTYIRKDNGRYVFLAYTTQQSDIYNKLMEDIDKCLDEGKTGLPIAEIEKIYCCHTSSNLKAGENKKLHDFCKQKGIKLIIWGIDEIAKLVYIKYRSSVKDFLGLSIDTGQIMYVDDFIKNWDANKLAAPLKTEFLYRQNEKSEILDALEKNEAVIITGKAGVGKTRIAIESIKEFADKNDYKLLCIKNNNLELYGDLTSWMEEKGKYLIFIDNANELKGLNHILEYTKKTDDGYNVKIIVTVRDYVKPNVLSIIKKYTKPKEIFIKSFTDKELKGFIKKVLLIKNEEYKNQIIRVAEGNPMIAYMAGKLAIEQKNLTTLRNVSEIYDSYYEELIKDANIEDDEELALSAGIIAFTNGVVLNDDESKSTNNIKSILKCCEIDKKVFENRVRKLSNFGLAEIKMDKYVKLSDKCFANYMLYYVFIKQKIIRLSKILEPVYKELRSYVTTPIFTIYNIFSSNETNAYCNQEILKVWKSLDEQKNRSFKNFVIDFHVFNPEESLNIAKNKIGNIKSLEFTYDINFSKRIFPDYNSILTLLNGYHNTDHLDETIELLFEFASKTNETFISGYTFLENNYGIDIDNYEYDNYNDQEKISSYLLTEIKNNNKIASVLGFRWAEYSLCYFVHGTKMMYDGSFTLYRIELKYTKNIVKYRKLCWQILISLADKEQWKNRLLLFIRNRESQWDNDSFESLMNFDTEYIDSLLEKLKSPNISFLDVLNSVSNKNQLRNQKLNKKWNFYFNKKEWKLYQILNPHYASSYKDYEESADNNDLKLSEYAANLSINEIPNFVDVMNKISFDPLLNDYKNEINCNFEKIISKFDDEQLKEFLNAIFNLRSNIYIDSEIVLKNVKCTNELLNKIKEKKFPQQIEWIYNFFANLPEAEVNSKMLDELLMFFKNDFYEKNKKVNIHYLLKNFINIEPNIYCIVSSLIYNNKKDILKKEWFSCLFNSYIWSPEDIIESYKNNISLLQDIYFFMIKNDSNTDWDGTFLIKFLELDDTWIQKYSDIIWENDNFSYRFKNRNNSILKSQNFIKYADYIFYSSPKDVKNYWKTINYFKYLLTDRNNDNNIKSLQNEWITHIITKNAKTERIEVIFNIICGLGETVNKRAIQLFLENNDDLKMFEKLTIIPKTFMCDLDSMEPFQNHIKYLNSLLELNIFAEDKFKGHRKRIKREIEKIKNLMKWSNEQYLLTKLHK